VTGPLFTVLLIGVVVIVGALTFSRLESGANSRTLVDAGGKTF